MKQYQPLIKKYLFVALLCLVAFSITIYLADVFLGDGDGVNAKFNLNPITILFYGSLCWVLVRGMISHKEWISKISTSLTVFFIGLLIIGFVIGNLSVFSIVKPKTVITLDGGYPFTSYDTVYFKNYNPNTQFIKKHFPKDGGGEIPININSDGIRGPEIQKKKDGEHRILLIGDSFIQALQVNEEDVLGHQMEQLLPDSIKVIQHGFASWSPLLEFNWLLRKGIEFEPDEVILFPFINDFFSGTYVSDQFYTKFAHFDQNNYPSSFSFEQSPMPKKNAFNHFLNHFQSIPVIKYTSYFRRLWMASRTLPSDQIHKKLHSPTKEFEHDFNQMNFNDDPLFSYYWDLVSVYRDTSIWDTTTRDRVDLSLSYIQRMSAYLDDKNIPFSIQLIPFAHQFEGENIENRNAEHFNGQLFPNTGISQRLDAFCQEHQISFTNLFNDFDDYKNEHPKELLYFNVDGHWNEKGHELAAQIIADDWLKTHSESLSKPE